MKDRFNPDTYMVVDRVTGEELDVAMFVKDVGKNGWERAYADEMARYIGITGEASSKVLAYFIKSRQIHDNMVIGTYPKISKETGVSESTVAMIIKKLLKGKFIKKVQAGVYMVSPSLIRYGSQTVGVIQMRLWMNA